MTCTGPNCTREAMPTAGLCHSHYVQQRRTGKLKPLRTSEPKTRVIFRCPESLKTSAERSAKREGIDPAEWWRRAGKERLK